MDPGGRAGRLAGGARSGSEALRLTEAVSRRAHELGRALRGPCPCDRRTTALETPFSYQIAPLVKDSHDLDTAALDPIEHGVALAGMAPQPAPQLRARSAHPRRLREEA